MIGEAGRLDEINKNVIEFKPVEATLLLTENCNLSCNYCYARASQVSTYPAMTKGIAKIAVDFIVENAKSHKHKCAEFRFLGGGEPTTEWDLLVWITNYIKFKSNETGVKHWIRLITNGIALSKNKIRWLSENIQYVTLSCDILPDLQMSRAFPNGKNSHGRVMHSAKVISQYNIPCHFRTTISIAGSDRMKEMVEYTNKYTNIKAIRFEPIADIGRASDNKMVLPRQQDFVNNFIDAYKLGRRYGILVTCKMMTNIWRRSRRFCNVEFSVTSNGSIVGCHRYSINNGFEYDLFHIGNITQDKIELNLMKVEEIKNIDVSYFSECKYCFAKWSCASGCLSARLNNGEINKKSSICYITKELLKFSIKEALS
ncbi:radical SAM protein [Edwardsiella ictaluri]|uniref:radical SAM protein n=1 Tax=Edwardsiella ictaluri TaxID=67780 RepID=UPI0039F6938C